MNRRMWGRWVCGGVLALLVVCGGIASARAEVTAEQKARIKAIENSLRGTRALFAAKKSAEADQAIEQAEKQINELKAAPNKDELLDLLAGAERLLAAAKTLRDAAAEKPTTPVKPLPKKPIPAKSPATPATPKTPVGPKTPVVGVSFSRDVAPILVAKCGSCHIEQKKGDFSIATVADLKRGTKDGVVIFPNKSAGSRLVEVIESGDMPRGGGKVAAEELTLIKKWIDTGAKDDTPGAATPLRQLAMNAGKAPATDPAAPLPPAADGTVRFSRDLAPVLVAQCTECHSGGNAPRNLDLATFAGATKGGQTGALFIAGDAAKSLLIQKLKGTALGQRMPRGKPALTAEVIAKFEKWIAEGARFDGGDPSQPIETLARSAVAATLSHEELAKLRADNALKLWKAAFPNEAAPAKVENERFVVVGNVNEARLAEVGELAKAVEAKVAAALKAPTDKPLIKGRLTLFVFSKRVDYGEFAFVTEKKELPTDASGHWRFSPSDAYGCVVPDLGDQTFLSAKLTEIIAGSYLDGLGTLPRWFARGAALAVVEKTDAKNPMLKTLDDAMRGALPAFKAEEFLARDMRSSADAALAYGIGKQMLGAATRFHGLLEAVRKGTAFDTALAQIYRSDARQIANNWAARGK